jgi:hypothetical protein
MLLAYPTPQTFSALSIVFVVVVIFVIVAAASRSRQYIARTDQKLCKSCGTAHPGFAQFCRRCGKSLVG